MYYEERWIDGKFCWRTSPDGAWTAYTANELAHRYQAELQRAHDLQRALDAEREKVKAEQEQWEIQAREGGRLKAQLTTLQAQLRQVEGQSKQQAEEAVIVFAKYTTLQQLLEDVLHTFGYLRFHRVAGMDGLLYETHNKMSPERTVEACEKRIRATLTPAAGGTRHGTN